MPAKFVGESEVEADRLGMPNMKISIGLGRKARLYTSFVLIGLQVVENNVANEVGRARLRRGVLAVSASESDVFISSDLTAKIDCQKKG